VKLYTERLILREYGAEDIEIIDRLVSDPDIGRFMKRDDGRTAEGTRRCLEELSTDRAAEERLLFHYLLIRPETGRAIGEAGLNIVMRNQFGGIGAIGYVLEAQARGHGFATEAARRLVEFGLKDLGLHKISATIELRNVRSVKVAERVGMKQEASLRQEAFMDNRWEDIALFAILRESR
jgi:ribosomal-protein-alanine N-acetyltransferase